MDPLSFSASLIAVLALATTVGKKVKQVVEGVKDAPAELTEIRNEIESLMWVIERLDVLFKEEASADQIRPMLWSREASRATDIELALESCTSVMTELSRKLDTAEGYLTGGPFDKMEYPFFVSLERNNLRDLRIRLAHSKTAILMSLQLRTLGIVQTIERATPVPSSLSGKTLVFDGDDDERVDSINSNAPTTFELEVYSSPDAWISKFR